VPGVGESAAAQECRRFGLAGAAMIALGGLSAGAIPARGASPMPGLDRLAAFETPGILAVYGGVVVLVFAWWRLGRLFDGPAPPDRATLLSTLATWAVPLVLAPPLFSRDVYSYLAQGVMVGSGLDVYRLGPAELGGPLAVEVPGAWQHAPAPYGPVFLFTASSVTGVTSVRVIVGVLAMRLLALLALGVIVALLPRLARACGTDPDRATWLAVLNPLVLLHLVSGAHNDALMLALLVAGLAAAVSGRPGWGAALVTLGALVKAPAVLGLPAVAALWSQLLIGRSRVLRAGVATGLAAAATTAAVTALTGTGFGWVGALSTSASAHSWSVTSVLGRLTQLLLQSYELGSASLATPLWRLAGMLAVGVVGVLLWVHRVRLGAIHALGLALTALAVLGPSIRPWYLLWGLVPLAVAAPDGLVRRWAPVACAVFALVVPPSGFWPTPARAVLATAGVAAACAVLAWLGWARGARVLAWPPGFGPRVERGEREPGYST
jgi:alpha-1,6-mannosyltransferase